MKSCYYKIKNRVSLYFSYMRVNLKVLEIYNIDFYLGIIAMLMSYVSELLALLFIFNIVPEINGWDVYQVLFIYGLNLIAFSLWSCFFINTITLPYYIQRGEFDRFLLRPIQPIIQIMLDGFDEDSFGELLTGLIILTCAWIKLKISIKFLIIVIVSIFSGCFIYAGISILLSTISFFTISQADVANFTMQIKEVAKYPITIYPKIMQFIFTFIFPVSLVAFIPSCIIFNKINIYYIIIIPFFSYIFYILSKKVWMLGVNHYGSTGT